MRDGGRRVRFGALVRSMAAFSLLPLAGCNLIVRQVERLYAESDRDRELPERIVAVNSDSPGWLYDLELSPDEKVFATAKWQGVEIHDAETLQRVRALWDERFREMDTCGDIEWSRDGKWIACALWCGWNNVVLYSYEEDRIVRVFRGHERRCHRVAMSPDSRLVASIGMQDPSVRVWDVATGEQAYEFVPEPRLPETFGVTCIAFSPDGKYLAAGLYGGLERRAATDGTFVRAVDLGDHIKYARSTPSLSTSNIIFNRASTRVLHIGDPDGHYWLSVPELEIQETLGTKSLDLPSDYDQAAYLESRSFLVGTTIPIYLLDLEAPRVVARLNTRAEKVHAGVVDGVDVTSDGRFLYTADGMGRILKWRIDDLVPPEVNHE